jgi:hypothetical protein
MKKYKTSEAIAMLEENPKLSFSHNNKTLTVDNGKLTVRTIISIRTIISKGKGISEGEGISDGYFINITDTWELIQQPVPFMEAMKSGKRVSCPEHGIKNCRPSWLLAEGIITIMMLDSEWFISEDSNE